MRLWSGLLVVAATFASTGSVGAAALAHGVAGRPASTSLFKKAIRAERTKYFTHEHFDNATVRNGQGRSIRSVNVGCLANYFTQKVDVFG